MHANLVGPARLGQEPQISEAAKPLDDLIGRLSGPSAVLPDGHALVVVGVPAMGVVNDIGVDVVCPPRWRDTPFSRAAARTAWPACGESPALARTMTPVVSLSRRCTIPARSRADLGQFLGVKGKGVEQRAAPVAPAGVGEQIGVLVDGDHVFVFIDDLDRDLLRDDLILPRTGMLGFV